MPADAAADVKLILLRCTGSSWPVWITGPIHVAHRLRCHAVILIAQLHLDRCLGLFLHKMRSRPGSPATAFRTPATAGAGPATAQPLSQLNSVHFRSWKRCHAIITSTCAARRMPWVTSRFSAQSTGQPCPFAGGRAACQISASNAQNAIVPQIPAGIQPIAQITSDGAPRRYHR